MQPGPEWGPGVIAKEAFYQVIWRWTFDRLAVQLREVEPGPMLWFPQRRR